MIEARISAPSGSLRWGRLGAALVVALSFAPPLLRDAHAQQRVILNKNFVQRVTRAGVALPDYLGTTAQNGTSNTYCTGPGGTSSCLVYIGDARCLLPTNAPEQTRGCTVGWLTTDSFDGTQSAASNGNVKAPVQIARGPAVEGVDLSNGGAELNAQNAGRLFQNVCLAPNESIPFSYTLGDPTSTNTSPSQARFGIFANSGANAFAYPGTPVSVVTSTAVQSTSALQSGTVTAPAAGGIYEIGFEAVQPAGGAYGNYITGVSIALKPLVDAGPAGGQNSTFRAPLSPATVVRTLLVRVNGQIGAGGMTIPLTLGGTLPASGYQIGTPAAIDVDFNPVSGASLSGSGANRLLSIPPGNYDANTRGAGSTTNPSGVVAIPLTFVDDHQTNPSLALSITIGTPGSGGSTGGSGWGLSDPRCDGSFSDAVTYTVLPGAAQITVTKVPTALDGTPFAFTTTAAAPDDAFTLSSSTALTRTFSVAPGTVAIKEGGNTGWVLTHIACSNAAGAATFTYTGATTNPSDGFERGDDTANVSVDYGDQVTCTYTNAPTALPTLAKFFNTDPPSDPAPQPPVIPRSGAALLTFVLSNKAPSANAQSGLAFTDTLPSGLVLANGTTPPSALVGTNTCGGAVTAQAGTNAIALAGGSAAAGADCSFTVRVGSAP